MIPVFVLLAIYYGSSVQNGEPVEWLRLAAIVVFVVAAASDGIDGWIARRYNQRTRLGAILDPIADKGLLITAIITLSVSGWFYNFPLWFPVLVIARDAVILTGSIILHYTFGHLEIRPSWTGKAATASQMVAIAWVMFQIPRHDIPVLIAGLLTLISGIGYVVEGLRRVKSEERKRQEYE